MNRIETEVKRRDKFLNKIIEEKKKEIKCAPQGFLRCAKSKNSTQYYYRKERGDTNGKYINKKNINLAKALAQKGYDTIIVKKAEEEREILNVLIHKYSSGSVEDAFNSLSKSRQRLIMPLEISDEEYEKEWIDSPFEGKEFSEDAFDFFTEKGERVRSKSEILIANALHSKNVPYKYEAPLWINDYRTKIYPDFTILSVSKRKEVIWEHFGMMDNDDYCKKTLFKLNSYFSNGYYYGDNFLFTFETSESPISTKQIEKIVEHYI